MLVREELLEQCLSNMESAGVSPQEALEAHPEEMDSLLPLLNAAQTLRRAPEVQPSTEFRATARTRMLNLIAASEAAKQAPVPSKRSRFSLSLPPAFARLALAATAVAVIALGGTGFATASAAPGSPLYTTKLAIEEIQLITARNEADRARIHLDIAEARIGEIKTAVQSGDPNAAAVASQYYEEHMRHAVEQALGTPDVQLAGTVDSRLAEQEKALEQAIGAEHGNNGMWDSVNHSLGMVEQERMTLQNHNREHLPGAGDHSGNTPSGTATTVPGQPNSTASPRGWVHEDPQMWQQDHQQGEPEPQHNGMVTPMPEQHRGTAGDNQSPEPEHNGGMSAPPVAEPQHEAAPEMHQEPAQPIPAPVTIPAPAATPAPMPQPAPHDPGSDSGGSHSSGSGQHMDGGH